MVSAWWNTTSGLESGLGFLRRLGLNESQRRVLALSTVTIGLVSLTALLSTGDEMATFGRAILYVAVPACAVLAVRLRVGPTPRRREVLSIIIGADVAIALGCLAHQLPVAGIAGCSLFAIMSSLCIFYCSPRQHALQAVFGSTVPAVIIALAAADGAGAATIFLLISKALGRWPLC